MTCRKLAPVLVLAAAALCAADARAQTVAAGPYYAMPSWDQTLPCSSPASCPRFVVLSNMNSEAVLDRETGLVWERSPLAPTATDTGLRGWFEANRHCANVATGNRRGWRLPTLQELDSLTDPSRSFPPLPDGHPFIDVQSDSYWTATSSAINSNAAFVVSFRNGGDARGGVNIKSTTPGLFSSSRVWCVRGGSGPDFQ